ncbi:glycine oxidase ThiO [Nesterenkonia populi]
MSTAVVGAGVVGLLTAWQLRLTGHSVTIFDPAPASEASYAAAGMLAPISEVQYGQEELWPLMAAALEEYPAQMAALQKAVRAPTGYWENGTLLVAADPGDREAVNDLVGVHQSHGMQVEPLTSRALREREPALAPGISKAWKVPGDHQVNPRQLVVALNEALSAELDPGAFPDAGPPAAWAAEKVVDIRHELGGVQLTTDQDNEHDAAAAVLVPGLGYSQITGIPRDHPQLRLRPVHGDVLRLRYTDGQLTPGERRLLTSTLRARVSGRQVYLVPREREELVIGASVREDARPGAHAGSVAELLADAIAVLPAVRDMELHEITARARPGTPDDRPYTGLLSPDVVVSTGYSRHGILLAPLAARLTAGMLNGTLTEQDRAHLEATDPRRHR